jgi:hypothetical protein
MSVAVHHHIISLLCPFFISHHGTILIEHGSATCFAQN